MSEVYLSAAGGAKVITLADCSFTNSNLYFPDGITWGDISEINILAVFNGSSQMGLKKEGTGLKLYNGQSWINNYSQPADTATSININFSGMYPAQRIETMTAILK